MTKNNNEGSITALMIILAVVCLLLGALVGYNIYQPREIEVDKIVYKDKLITVEIEKEVIVTETVEVDVTESILEDAIDVLLEEIEDEEDLQECDEEEYDEDQVEVKRIYDEYSITYDEDEYTVEFRAKLKYLDSDVEEKCYNTYDVSVLFEEDEDPEIEITEV